MNKYMLNALAVLGFSEEEFNKYRIETNNNNNFFIVLIEFINDYYNALFLNNRKIDYHKFKMAYFELSLFAAYNKLPYLKLKNEVHKFELLGYKDSKVVKKVQILAANDQNVCDYCKSINHNIYSFEEAFSLNPLDENKCTCDYLDTGFGWCRCTYLPIVK